MHNLTFDGLPPTASVPPAVSARTDGKGAFQAATPVPLGAAPGPLTIVASAPVPSGGTGQARMQVEVNGVTCDDFEFQEPAQEILNANPADPNHLNADNKGVACPSLPHRPGGPAVPPLSAAARAAAAPAAAAPGGAPAMPNTGSPVGPESVLATLLIGVGAALETAARRGGRHRRRGALPQPGPPPRPRARRA